MSVYTTADERARRIRAEDRMRQYGQQADDYRDLIRRIEWKGWLERTGERACPVCLFPQSGGTHSPRCQIADALACDDCGDTGTYETSIVRNGIVSDVPLICSCPAGEKLRNTNQ